jgi:hypothetical protein
MPVDPRIQAIIDAPLTTPTDLRFAPMKGHVQPPGTGPIGETCGSCRNRHPTGSDFKEWICALDRTLPRVPITALEKACGRWEARRHG